LLTKSERVLQIPPSARHHAHDAQEPCCHTAETEDRGRRDNVAAGAESNGPVATKAGQYGEIGLAHQRRGMSGATPLAFRWVPRVGRRFDMSAVEHGEITATNGQSNLPHWQKDREVKRQNVNPRAGGGSGFGEKLVVGVCTVCWWLSKRKDSAAEKH
jgi:hypothetical protein